MRLLSQTASSFGCEQNWTVFEHVDTKRRNRLEHKWFSNLVFVHYNMHLQHRYNGRRSTCDPIDYESIDAPAAWVEEPTPYLAVDSLDAAFPKEDDYSNIDFGHGVGGATYEDTGTLGLPT
ncbi:hypothetical protein LINGRAHAP2_LOCUS29053 [Linum grandiflorum]